jgi:hypothetical protein
MTTQTEIKKAQSLINSGIAWQLEGAVGRHCMDMINAGYCMLGHKGHKDYWGNYVPSRYEVKEGTKGSAQFVKDSEKNRNDNGGFDD